MGNWQLEVAKMAIYMAFPVTSFYVYHQVSRHSKLRVRTQPSKGKLSCFSAILSG
jgi:hypothetical protein